ncbi:MAG: transposase [Candidatus Neomarinimicrobiota bacterium]|jgi:transposase
MGMAQWFTSKSPPSGEEKLRLLQSDFDAVRTELSKVRSASIAKDQYVEQCRREKSNSEMTIYDLRQARNCLEADNALLRRELEDCRDKLAKLQKANEENRELVKKLSADNKKLGKILNIRSGKEAPFGESGGPSTQRSFKNNASAEKQLKKGGARKGHAGHGRKIENLEHIDRVENIEFPADMKCPSCSGSDFIIKGYETRQYNRLIPARVETVQSRMCRLGCVGCGHTVLVQPDDVMPYAKYSNSFFADMACECYLRRRTIGSYCSRYGIQRGTALNMMNSLVNYLEPAYTRLGEEMIREDYLHADETVWYNNGHRGYAWGFFNNNYAYFVFPDSRAGKVVKKVFRVGSPETAALFNMCMVLIHDRYSAYTSIPVKHQNCYEHLKRDLIKMLEFDPDSDEAQRFVVALKPLLVEAMHLCANKDISDEEYYLDANKIKEQILKIVNAPANDGGVQGYQYIWRSHPKNFFQWVENRNVRCENNFAERGVRSLVIVRKTSFGTQGEKGLKARQVLGSVLGTVKIRGGDPYQFICDVLRAKGKDKKADVCKFLPPKIY